MDMERGRSIGRNEGIWRKGRKGYGGRGCIALMIRFTRPALLVSNGISFLSLQRLYHQHSCSGQACMQIQAKGGSFSPRGGSIFT